MAPISNKTMASVRLEKFEKQMQRDLSEIFQQKSRDWFGGAFITISRVQSSPDLGYIKCSISLLNEKEPAKTLSLIDEKIKEIRMELAHRNKHLRKAPELSFIEDTSLEYVSKMEAIFASLKKNK
ncbi:MAG: 30S ribosome-binding factor RbfA [Bacteroidia bacterium]|nr:30S ribosome-binding factor RbfA [Bacteroidia bacterium]